MESVEGCVLPIEILRMIAECNNAATLKISGLCKLFYFDLYKIRRQRCCRICKDRDKSKRKIYYISRVYPTRVIETIEFIPDERIIIGIMMETSKCKRTYYTDDMGCKRIRWEMIGDPNWGMEPFDCVIDDKDDYEASFDNVCYDDLLDLPTIDSSWIS